MSRTSSVHVVQRADGVWQVERETEVIPLSVHDELDDAIDAALELARREHRAVSVHQWPRPRARWLDRVAWALLDDGERAPDLAPAKILRAHPRRSPPGAGHVLRRAAG